jgi:glc operon protein GlcG
MMKTQLLFIALLFCALVAFSQQPKPAPPLNYGEPINLETAKKIAAAGEAFAVKNQWTIVIAIVDTGGNIVLLQRMDNTQIGSVDVALGKARTANNFKRPTKAFEDAIAGGSAGARVLSIDGVYAIEGGEPIISNGKIIGGIGVSGMSSTQDEEVVKAGLAALNK